MTECKSPLHRKIDEDEEQLIKLCLKKPKQWNWELTTSKSSSNIAFPKIQLFDEDNRTLLTEACEANFTAGSKLQKSASVSTKIHRRNSAQNSDSNNTRNPITIETFEEEAQSVVQHDPDRDSWRIDNDKKMRVKSYSRSNSFRSRSSILKRIREFSELTHDSSSEEENEENASNISKDSLKKKYSMRTCNIGTILVPKEDLSNVRRRRKKSSDANSDKVTASLPHSPRIIDVQDTKINIDTQKYLKEVKASSPSSDEVFLLLVKRLASLHCNNNSNQLNKQSNNNLKSSQTTNCGERDKNSDYKSKVADNDQNKKASVNTRINDSVIHSAESNEIMGSNVGTLSNKGLSHGRRTQSQSNIDNKSSISNGICCSTKYSKSKRKPSNISQQDFDKKPFNNNNCEHFDGIGQIIAANANVQTAPATKTNKKSNQIKSNAKEKDKKKHHGSLPNHLDTDCCDDGSDETHNTSIYQYQSNQVPTMHPPNYENAQLSAIRKFDEIYQQQHRYQAEHHFVHLKQQNLSFRVANTYAKQNFLRSQETNSFRIPQAYANRMKFDSVKVMTPNSPSPAIDQCYDQGYGSERSPEEEVLPPLPVTNADNFKIMLANSLPQELSPNTNQMYEMNLQKFQQQTIQQNFDFIKEDCTFNVEIVKGPRGLGLSVSGGIDSSSPYPGLIRIKRLFPHQAAWLTGQLQPGDILLEANGIILTGLTNNEALEVLRTMANVVNLLVCRPHDENFRKLSPSQIEKPIPPVRSSFNMKHQQYMNQLELLPPGEFEITLVKQQGSLGFTLQKEDDSISGHYVRALVREPATTDGRIRAGDKILAVNDVVISNMTHEQAVIFLRQAPETVKLRLFRMDEFPTSDFNCCENNSTLKRSKLRPEAMSLINVLATRKNTQSSSDENSSSFHSSTMSSPRRLRKNKITSASDTENFNDSSSNISSGNNMSYVVSEGTSSGTHTPFSDSSADTLTIVSQRVRYYDPHELPADDDDTNNGFYDSDELENLEHDDREAQLKRPEYLNLQSGQADSGSTPIALRKPMYKFSIATANAYELNNLDSMLDAPTSCCMQLGMDKIDGELQDSDEHNFTSLPCETLLLACKTENDLKNSSDGDIDTCLYVKNFSKNQPLYQSAQVQFNHKHQQQQHDEGTGEMNLLKWKGVTMPLTATANGEGDMDDDKCSIISSEPPMASLRVSIRNAQKDINLEEMCIDSNENKIITIEMNRRWSCRLGIRLENRFIPNADGGSDGEVKSITVIKEICKETLAEKDGRLKAGDRVLMINDEIVDSKSTQEIIDMMRIIRGPLCITVARKIDS